MSSDQTPRESSFLSDVKALRAPARRHVDLAAVTAGYKATRETVQRLMGESLATEIVCVLRRYQHDAGRGHSQHPEGRGLLEVVQEDLLAERIAIESYLELIRHVGDHDPTTCCLLESILAAEEDYARELISLLRGERR
jgi:bacterioferritin